MLIDTTGSREDLPLEERVARLEDISAIQTLWAHYAYLADTERDGAALGALHIDDAAWSATGAGNFGRHEGRTSIERFFDDLYSTGPGADGPAMPFRHHNMTNGYVALADDRQSATGRWKLTDMCTVAGDSADAILLLGDYENEFVKSDGVWKIAMVELTSHSYSNWHKGWVVQPDLSAGT